MIAIEFITRYWWVIIYIMGVLATFVAVDMYVRSKIESYPFAPENDKVIFSLSLFIGLMWPVFWGIVAASILYEWIMDVIP